MGNIQIFLTLSLGHAGIFREGCNQLRDCHLGTLRMLVDVYAVRDTVARIILQLHERKIIRVNQIASGF